MRNTKKAAAGLLLALSAAAQAQLVRSETSYVAILPSTVSPTISQLGPSWYAAGMIDDKDGLLGVTGCREGRGHLYIAESDGGVRSIIGSWSSSGSKLGDAAAALICRAALGAGYLRPINPQTL